MTTIPQGESFESQLRELCAALGWQGGTFHQVLAEVERLKARDASRRNKTRRIKALAKRHDPYEAKGVRG